MDLDTAVMLGWSTALVKTEIFQQIPGWIFVNSGTDIRSTQRINAFVTPSLFI